MDSTVAAGTENGAKSYLVKNLALTTCDLLVIGVVWIAMVVVEKAIMALTESTALMFLPEVSFASEALSAFGLVLEHLMLVPSHSDLAVQRLQAKSRALNTSSRVQSSCSYS